LCFEGRFSKQKGVIRLKSNFFGPPKIFGLTTPLMPAGKETKPKSECYAFVEQE